MGRVGSLVVLIALFLIFFILLSGKLLFQTLQEIFEGGEEIQTSSKQVKDNNRVQSEISNRRRKERKMKTYKFPGKTEKEDISKKERRWKKKGKNIENIPDIISEVGLTEAEAPGLNIIRSGTSEEPIPRYEEEIANKFGKDEEADTSVKVSQKADTKNTKENIDLHKEVHLAEKKKIADVQKSNQNYKYPSLSFLNTPKVGNKGTSNKELTNIALKLQSTLESFGVRVRMGDISCGPSVTRYELIPEQGVKVSKITGLADDIKLSLAASDIRIEAPIPGKAAVGIEVPNREKQMVTFRELLESNEFEKAKSKLSFAVGKDISGKTIVTDVAKMPHLLVAGATGSGKSVCINTLIMSILYKAHPDEVKMILIDPKMVEFGIYNDIPHLMIPVVTDPKKASAALNWAVVEMTGRYNKFSELGVRNIEGYNKRIQNMTTQENESYQAMPQVVIIVDEFADLMMVAPGEVEDAVCRLAQLARAAGIHLVLATQRPSVNVITGLIKANIPSRIALSVSSAIDSRTIIDSAGAEKLLGNGDMLFAPGDFPKPVRIQGAFISEKEVSKVVEFLKSQFDTPAYNSAVAEQIETAPAGGNSSGDGTMPSNDRDELFVQAAEFIIEKDKASIGMLQRVFRIGFNRAARIMDQLYEAGVVGPEEGTKPRAILMSAEQFENYLEEHG